MTTLLVDISDEQEERVLLAFLNSLKYNYRTGDKSDGISDSQKDEILRREQLFESGKMKSEPWEEIRKRFLH